MSHLCHSKTVSHRFPCNYIVKTETKRKKNTIRVVDISSLVKPFIIFL